nr:hypothetical protein [Tanacetum cinerariifolium]
IQRAQLEDSNEFFQKLLEDLKELTEYNHPIFFDDNEDHSFQNKENLENSSNSNQEKEGPPQDSDIRQLIREECCIEVCEKQKQNMENTILNLSTKRASFLDKKEQEVKNVVEQPSERGTLAPILSNKEPEYSPSIRYEHPNTTSETKSDEIIKSGVEELVPILNENEVTLEDKRECDFPVCENSPICDDHSKI